MQKESEQMNETYCRKIAPPFPSGDQASRCHLPDGHDGNHKGFLLGSIFSWSDKDAEEMEEEEIRLRMLDSMETTFGISPDFVESSDHPYKCTCEKCADWWRQMGQDPDTNRYGPFGESLPTERKVNR